MSIVLRCMAAVVAGLIVAFVLVVAVEVFSAVVHPVPSDFGGTMEETCRHVAHYPNWVLALVVPAWGATAFVSTWTAERIGNRWCALFVGILLVAAVVLNLSMLPYPVWFKGVTVLAIPTAVVLGSRLPIRRKAIVRSATD